MVSDTVLVQRLREILSVSDLETTTASIVRRMLEEEFDVDLSDRRAFVREQIDLFLRTHVQETPPEDEEEPDKSDDSCSQEEDEESDTETKKKQRSNKMNGEAKKKTGFNKPCALSPQLQILVGESELGRPEVVKKIWAYIREKNLQDPKNKRKILCDEVLTGIFRVKTIDMFRMNKVLSKHIWPIEETDATQVKSSKKKRLPKQGREEDEPKQTEKKHKVGEKQQNLGEKKQKVVEKKQKVGGSGFLAPVRLSDALMKFFGNDNNTLPRSDVIKRIWQYIKENELQDPSDKRMIICDERLKELFQVDSFNGFTVTKLLTAHLVKIEN